MKQAFAKIIGVWFFAAIVLTGCAKDKTILPVHDEILTYPLAFDVTYLRTLEALENIPDWELEETEKEKGIIRVRNVAYSRFDDADKRVATFYITRVSRSETTIQLAPGSQQIIGGDKLLEKIKTNLGREVQ